MLPLITILLALPRILGYTGAILKAFQHIWVGYLIANAVLTKRLTTVLLIIGYLAVEIIMFSLTLFEVARP